jgi:hypothetical protein
MVKNTTLLLLLSFALFGCSGSSSLTSPSISAASSDSESSLQLAEDALLGTWGIVMTLDNPDLSSSTEGKLLLTRIEKSDNESSTFVGTGCMQIVGQETSLPLSFQATHSNGSSSYDLVIVSTLIDTGEEPTPRPIRFLGSFSIEEAEGAFSTQDISGSWLGNLLSKAILDCVGIDSVEGLLAGDLHAVKDATSEIARFDTIIDVQTALPVGQIVVVAPDGQEIFLEAYSDFWAPQLELEGVFRYLGMIAGEPIIGAQGYSITLFDILGQAIPGAIITDGYLGCEYGGPNSVVVEVRDGNDLHLSWELPDRAENIEGLTYQISITSLSKGDTSFGADDIREMSHIIPWEQFDSESRGAPDGWDFGSSLNALEDGEYEIAVSVFFPSQDSGASFGSECAIFDNSQNLRIEISGGAMKVIE